MNLVKCAENKMPAPSVIPGITCEQVHKARAFHSSFPEYSPTPLVDCRPLAEIFGVKNVYVKDESKRFGLNAFKILGASFAMGEYLRSLFGLAEAGFDKLKAVSAKRKIPFFAATDGNHGRAVAWTASKLGQPACIYMPKGSSPERLENIRKTGARAEILDMNYDDAVRFAAAEAEAENGVIIQDTAWDGYEEIPQHIMEGYGVIADEILEQTEMPTHVILQAGVGSFAAGIAGMISDYCGTHNVCMPEIIIAESDKADCYYKSACVGDGKPQKVGGDMQTLMAGLACGEPNTIAFELLKSRADFFASCDDKVSADGMRILSSVGIVSGESGAVTCGLLAQACLYDTGLKEMLNINENSRVLLISTEGNTDRQRYRDIVWFGRSAL